MKSSYFNYTLILLFVITGCADRNKDNKIGDRISRQTIGKGDTEAFENTLLTVKIGTPKSRIKISDHHLYGKFFQDRAEFFVIENPKLYLSDTKVEELTLYFIDGVLCKKKYRLADDISRKLMANYGTFKFRAINDSSKLVSKSEGILKKVDGKKFMNDNLTYYRMKWPKNDPLLYYEYKRDSIFENRLLIEELADYKDILREAERSI